MFNKQMTAAEFDLLVSLTQATGSVSLDAARMVLVDGVGVNEAGRRLGITKQSVSATALRILSLRDTPAMRLLADAQSANRALKKENADLKRQITRLEKGRARPADRQLALAI